MEEGKEGEEREEGEEAVFFYHNRLKYQQRCSGSLLPTRSSFLSSPGLPPLFLRRCFGGGGGVLNTQRIAEGGGRPFILPDCHTYIEVLILDL